MRLRPAAGRMQTDAVPAVQPSCSRKSRCYMQMRQVLNVSRAASNWKVRRRKPFGFCPARRGASRGRVALGATDGWDRDGAMGAEVLIGDSEAARLTSHPLRAAILGEVHALPFTLISVQSGFIYFTF